VDVVYYGSTAASPSDASAVWNVYDSQFSGGAWTVKQVSNTPNRVGAICLNGSACSGNTNRELLDLFQVAEDPLTGKAAIIYTAPPRHPGTPNSVRKALRESVVACEQGRARRPPGLGRRGRMIAPAAPNPPPPPRGMSSNRHTSPCRSP